jgi:hypothetical protein
MPGTHAEKPLAAWLGHDRYQDQVLRSLTIILKTGGCRWNRCRMCSYRHERYGAVPQGDLESLILAQLDAVRSEFAVADADMVKIYTSGSFFDTREVPREARDAAARLFSGKLVIAETRPEYVDETEVSRFRDAIDTGRWQTPLYVAMGLETTSDAVREKSIDKGFTMEDFKKAVRIARSAGAGVKTYLLHKPLFLTEAEAMADMQSSIRDLAGLSDMVSMNPCTVQRGTELEWYWKRGAYRPPYLWSVLELLSGAPVHVTCDPVGGGRERGPHNCGSCDPPLVRGIREYSISGDRELLKELRETWCPCRDEWSFVLREERPYCAPLTR